MSYLSEDAYKSKMEKVEQGDKVKKEICYYELTDGSWLCLETTYEATSNEYDSKSWKRVSSSSSSHFDKPDSVSKEQQLKKLIELGKKLI